MDESDAALIARLTAIADETGSDRRSGLTLWLTKHHDEFAQRIAAKAPDWEALARALGEAGILDGRGEKPNGQRLRKTWWLVTTRLKGKKRPPKPDQTVNKLTQTAPPPPRDSAAFTPRSEPEDDLPRPKFPFSRPKKVDE